MGISKNRIVYKHNGGLNNMTTFTTEDRQNASPPHIVDSGASVKTLADYIEQETREEMLRNQMHLLHERVKELEIENVKLKREIENFMNGKR